MVEGGSSQRAFLDLGLDGAERAGRLGIGIGIDGGWRLGVWVGGFGVLTILSLGLLHTIGPGA